MMAPVPLSGEDTGKEPAAEFHVSTMPGSRQVLSMTAPNTTHFLPTTGHPLGAPGEPDSPGC